MRVQLTDRARAGRRHQTLAERKIWQWLRRRHAGFHFRRQHPVAGYILDFYCAALKLCIEVDGGVHDTAERFAYDEERRKRLAAFGIAVLRLRNEHIMEQPDGAWALIVDAVAEAQRRVQGS